MNSMDKIVAIAAMVGSLMLVTGGTRFRAIPLAQGPDDGDVAADLPGDHPVGSGRGAKDMILT
jgi:hypothetical protein